MALTPRTDWDPSAWRQDAFAPIRHVLREFEHDSEWPSVGQLNARLGPRIVAALGENAPAFEEQKVTPKRRRVKQLRSVNDLYDGRICVARCIPTRSKNWHDFFNACVWAWLPRTKYALSTRQFIAAKERLPAEFLTLPSVRTREQDALALFDEGGVLGVGASPQRAIFGHALYEHLVSSDERVWGFDIAVNEACGHMADGLDEALAHALKSREWPQLGPPSTVWLQRSSAAPVL